MGNDGGSIPKRRELVKDAARAPTISELKAKALESLGHAWNHCALSGTKIDLESVVSDWRGRLYNYESILKGLLPTDADCLEPTPDSFGIKSLRDVVKLKFSKNGNKYICPISMKEMGPGAKSIYLIPCGHVFAEIAIKEVQAKACPECGEDFEQKNIIPVLPTAVEDIEKLEKRISDLRAAGQTHTLKKDKSSKKKKRKGGDLKQGDGDGDGDGIDTAKTGVAMDSRISGINNPLAASLTAKVLAEQDERNKRRKILTEIVRS